MTFWNDEMLQISQNLCFIHENNAFFAAIDRPVPTEYNKNNEFSQKSM